MQTKFLSVEQFYNRCTELIDSSHSQEVTNKTRVSHRNATRICALFEVVRANELNVHSVSKLTFLYPRTVIIRINDLQHLVIALPLAIIVLSIPQAYRCPPSEIKGVMSFASLFYQLFSATEDPL